MANKSAKVYRVSFSWGTDYRNTEIGLVSCEINISDATNKFDAMKQAFDLVSDLVEGKEPSKMSATTQDS